MKISEFDRKPLDEFVKTLCDITLLNVICIQHKYYRISLEEKAILQSVSMEPEFIGEFLGEYDARRKFFKPSFTLINILFTHAKKRFVLNEKGAYLYICGRDVMSKSILDQSEDLHKGDAVVISDGQDFCLGYGTVVANLRRAHDEQIVIENKLDLGNFLRREMTHSSKKSKPSSSK